MCLHACLLGGRRGQRGRDVNRVAMYVVERIKNKQTSKLEWDNG